MRENTNTLAIIPVKELEDVISKLLRVELDKKATQLQKEPRGFGRAATAHKLSISPPTLDRYVRDGLIKAKKTEGRTIFSQAEIERFLEA